MGFRESDVTGVALPVGSQRIDLEGLAQLFGWPAGDVDIADTERPEEPGDEPRSLPTKRRGWQSEQR